MIRLLAALLVTSLVGTAPMAFAQTSPTDATKPVEVKPAEVKPAEVKPVEVKPAETKPTEAKPAEAKPLTPLTPLATPPVRPAAAPPAPPAQPITAASVSTPNQFGTLVGQCEKAKSCLKGTKADCDEGIKCTAFFEGVIGPMRQACLQRKTNNTIPKILTTGSPKSMTEMIDAAIDFAKANPADRVKHKAAQTMLAFNKSFPCEN